jgi:non-ribosomal peptide synthetase component F
LIHRDFTLYEVVKGNAQVFPDRLAAVDEDRRLTFKQFFDLVNRLAVGLRKEGIKRGIGLRSYQETTSNHLPFILPRPDVEQYLSQSTLV